MAQLATQFPRSSRDTLYEDIVESLENLPEVLRAIFTRSHYDGMMVPEISAELNIPCETVKRLLADANRIFYGNLHRFRSDS